MKKIRAIYIGDVKHNQCPVFELNIETGWFEVLEDNSFSYEKECVYDDKSFLVFDVENEDVNLIIR
ncbi:hypothetical protein [Clostridium sp.]|jgi:hypothetical protein|uniref:hypothetical protein n=1 Tax=Clostridium sp. TaxID=1506 RepID=UPI003FD8C688